MKAWRYKTYGKRPFLYVLSFFTQPLVCNRYATFLNLDIRLRPPSLKLPLLQSLIHRVLLIASLFVESCSSCLVHRVSFIASCSSRLVHRVLFIASCSSKTLESLQLRVAQTPTARSLPLPQSHKSQIAFYVKLCLRKANITWAISRVP
jgi:hypothetical protein